MILPYQQIICFIYFTAILVTGGYSNRKSAYKYEDGKWIKLSKLPNYRRFHNSIEVGGRSFIIGGIGCNMDGNKITEYKNGQFVQVAVMEDTLGFFAICKFDEQNVFIAGGKIESTGGNRATKKCKLFNINTFKFSSIADMNQARIKFALVECNQKYYAVGGKDTDYIGGIHTNLIECYNKKTNKWSYVFRMKRFRDSHQATSYENKIYIIGGCCDYDDYSNKIDVFDPINNNDYELDIKLKISRNSFACCRLNDCVYLVGGKTKDGDTNKVEVFNLKDKTLYFIENLPYSDNHLSACILYD